MNDTVVVTGAAGSVGAHITRALVHQGPHVVATDLAPELPAAVLKGLDGSGGTYVPADLRRPETIDALVAEVGGGADVVHVAALPKFAEMAKALGEDALTLGEALEVFEVNAMGTWQLCSKFADAGSLGRFIYISTRSVFAGLETDAATIVESKPQRPIGLYGSSKTAAEVGILALRDVFGLNLAVGRITGVFGPWQTPTSWTAKIVEAVERGEPYRSDSGGDDRYEFTYAKDTARGVVAMLQAQSLAHDIYHLFSGATHSLSEVVAAFRAADPEAVVEFGPGGSPGGRLRKPLDGTRAAEDLGFRPRWTLDAAIADYLEIQRSGDYGSAVVSGPAA